VEIKQIKELMAVMQRTGTQRLVIKKGDVEIQLERNDQKEFSQEAALNSYMEENPLKEEIAQHRAMLMLSRGGELTSSPVAAASASPVDSQPGSFITSPMVGTFYTSPSPEAASFVKVGDKIEKNTVVGIIEAMKVMNEIKAGVAGTVAEIMVDSGQPVEFGSKLFRVV
jgi:acetyl-CoA carboxylase biotin carboxyl carrier protein